MIVINWSFKKMQQNPVFKLRSTNILNVPIDTYKKDFTFIVNNEEFKTSRLVSELLSPKIIQQHQNDPTLDYFIINTKHQGHFSYILELTKFNDLTIPRNELPFISEIISKLGTTFIDMNNINSEENTTRENVFYQLKEYLMMEPIFSSKISEKIEFISLNFSELYEEKREELENLPITVIEDIINNENLRLKDEDQLLKFVNDIYKKYNEQKQIDFYRYVIFSNVSQSSICEFLKIYDINDLTNETWETISDRLKNTTKIDLKNEDKSKRYKKYDKEYDFDGIIKYMKTQTNNNIKNKINITSSSKISSHYEPINATLYDDQNKYFRSNDNQNSWICFEFKENKIIPTKYQILSYKNGKNGCNPKSWIIEGSNDNSKWEKLDEQKNCSYLNDSNVSHLFTITNLKGESYSYIRMRLTGPTWNDCYHLTIDSFEIYGLIL